VPAFVSLDRPYRYLFIHRRTSKSGTERLVVVMAEQISGFARDQGPGATALDLTVLGDPDAIQARRFNPPPPRRRSHLLMGSVWTHDPHASPEDDGWAERSIELALGVGDPAGVWNGQPDPSDESHFTIAYDVSGEWGMIDGWLLDDGTVKLECRDGPGKPYN